MRLVAAGVLAAVLSGCAIWSGSSPKIGGPLGAAGAPGELCAPGDSQGRLAYGFLNLTSHDDEPVTLEELRLLRPERLSIVNAFVMPIRSRTLYGARPGWLDAPSGAKVEGFGERQGIPGATLVKSYRVDTNLVANLIVASPDLEGRADGLELRYRDHHGAEHLWQSPIAIRVVPAKASCS